MPDERIRELAGLWWGKAVDDLDVAKTIASFPFARCFHCQQAVEKGIKALLVLYQIDFRKLHDVGQLLELLRNSPVALDEGVVEGLEALTRFAIEVRYPPGDASPEEAEQALSMAQRFLAWAQKQLPTPFPR